MHCIGIQFQKYGLSQWRWESLLRTRKVLYGGRFLLAGFDLDCYLTCISNRERRLLLVSEYLDRVLPFLDVATNGSEIYWGMRFYIDITKAAEERYSQIFIVHLYIHSN